MTASCLSNQIMPRWGEREGRERKRHTAQSQIPLLVAEWVPSLSLSVSHALSFFSPFPSISSDYTDRLSRVPAWMSRGLNKKWQLKHHLRLQAEWQRPAGSLRRERRKYGEILNISAVLKDRFVAHVKSLVCFILTIKRFLKPLQQTWWLSKSARSWLSKVHVTNTLPSLMFQS